MAERSDVQLPPDQDRGPMLLGVTWTTVALASIAVLLRLYCRTILQNAMGGDDIAMLAALISTIVGNTFITLRVRSGYGRHVYYLSTHQIIETSKWTTISQIQSATGVYLVKLSVCLFVLRMIARTHKFLRRILFIVITILTLVMVAGVLVVCLQCIPLEAVWNTAVSARCIPGSDLSGAIKAFNAFGVATDLICVMLPIFVLRGLQMKTRTKVGLMVVLALGVFTAACSLGKTILTQFKSDDITWDLIDVEIWANLEQNLGIIIASLPIHRRLFSGDLGGKRIRSYLSRFKLSRKKFIVHRSQSDTSNGQKTVADHLFRLKDIHVRMSLEVELLAPTPSDCEPGHGSDNPDDWRTLDTDVQTAVEKV